MRTTDDYFSVATAACICDTPSVSEGGVNALKSCCQPPYKTEEEEVHICMCICLYGQMKHVC